MFGGVFGDYAQGKQAQSERTQSSPRAYLRDNGILPISTTVAAVEKQACLWEYYTT